MGFGVGQHTCDMTNVNWHSKVAEVTALSHPSPHTQYSRSPRAFQARTAESFIFTSLHRLCVITPVRPEPSQEGADGVVPFNDAR